MNATRTPGSLAWYITDPTLTPYQRRLWPRLITDSDLAACRSSKGRMQHRVEGKSQNTPSDVRTDVLQDDEVDGAGH